MNVKELVILAVFIVGALVLGKMVLAHL